VYVFASRFALNFFLQDTPMSSLKKCHNPSGGRIKDIQMTLIDWITAYILHKTGMKSKLFINSDRANLNLAKRQGKGDEKSSNATEHYFLKT
jgi:hypothetical protein